MSPVATARQRAKKTETQSIHSQIDKLLEQKQRIIKQSVAANNTVREFQKKFDQAQADYTAAGVSALSHPSKEASRLAVSKRSERDTCRDEHAEAVEALQLIPVAQSKLDADIKALRLARDVRINTIVQKNITPDQIEKLKEKAKKSIAIYAAFLVMAGDRNIQHATASNIVATLGRKSEKGANLDEMMHAEFKRIETKLRFAEL